MDLSRIYKDNDIITVTVNNIPSYVTITYPTEGQTVKGHVVITTDTSADIDTVEFYIDGVLKKTDTAAPFQWRWNTRKSGDGPHTITVKGYSGGTFMDDDIVNITAKNKKNSIALLTWLIFFLPAGIYYKRR